MAAAPSEVHLQILEIDLLPRNALAR